MTLKNFAYHARLKLDRAGLSDHDIFLYPAFSPLGFFQPSGRAIAMSLPHVLIDSWGAVIKTFDHEIAHARTADEKETHGEKWAHEARCNGAWERRDENTAISDEFHECRAAYEADSGRYAIGEMVSKTIAVVMHEEGLQRSKEPRRPGRLRLDFIINRKGEINV
jgi:hypothetical protein